MSQWRYKGPDTFPRGFHDALLLGEGEGKVAARRITRAAIDSDRTQWNIFRYSLRQTPGHPLHRIEAGFIHRTKVVYNRERELWELHLTSRRKVMEDIVSMR